MRALASVVALALLVWKTATSPSVEYSTVRVAAHVLERGRGYGRSTVIPAHDEIVCVKR
jgi:hypothetical protein